MSYGSEAFHPRQFTFAAQASAEARADFIAKTYFHLAGAIMAFVGVEAILLNSPIGESLFQMVMAGGQIGWLLVLGAFILLGRLMTSMAHSASPGTQYAGLGLYVVLQAIIFVPLLMIANRFYPDAIATAALLTFLIFSGLTGVVFITRKNFSFIGPALGVASLAAIGIIFCSVVFGFHLGLLFIGGMIVLACGFILYDTSRVLHEYHIGQHVGASLQLFASVALLFWYILQLVMSFRD